MTGNLCYNGRVKEVFHHLIDPNQTIHDRSVNSMAIPEFTTAELQNEEWRPVVGYEGVYSVSNLGRVRRDIDGTGNTKAGRILCPRLDEYGYAYLFLALNGKRNRHTVHKLVTAAFIGERPPEMQVNHKDAVKTNNRLSNLEYCTCEENIHHASKMGLMATGDRHGSRTKPESRYRGHSKQVKIKDAELPRVFELRSKGMLHREIAAIFGVSEALIQHILKGRARATAARKMGLTHCNPDSILEEEGKDVEADDY